MFADAANWIAALLTGSMATAFAILAVAVVGFSLLFGRVSYERAVRVVLGCFMLFGAGQIATTVVELSGSPQPIATSTPLGQPTYAPGTPDPAPIDPYAGAAAPRSVNGFEAIE